MELPGNPCSAFKLTNKLPKERSAGNYIQLPARVQLRYKEGMKKPKVYLCMHNPSTGRVLCVQLEMQGRDSPVGVQAQDGPAPLQLNKGRATAGRGRGAGGSTELNRSIISDQEKHLCVREQRVQAVPFCARCHLIPCTAGTYRNPAAPTPLARKNQHQRAIKVQVGKVNTLLACPPGGKQRAPLGALSELSDLCSTAASPANRAARGSGAAGTLCTSQQLLCKEPEFIKPLACV